MPRHRTGQHGKGSVRPKIPIFAGSHPLIISQSQDNSIFLYPYFVSPLICMLCAVGCDMHLTFISPDMY